MASELQELKEMVEQLRMDNDRLRREQAALSQPAGVVGTGDNQSASASSSSAPQPTSCYDRLLYVPRERKCPMFRGPGGMGVAEWIEEVRASVRARHLKSIDQAYFIYDHLEGEAKNEIKFRPASDREDPEKILSILNDLYGCSQSYVSLQEAFFSRRQLEGESLQEYSHALFRLMDQVVASAPNGVPNSDILLRDQFIENVLDPSLRRVLKQSVRSNSVATLLDVRSEALRWEREGRVGEGRQRSYSVPSLCAVVTSRAHPAPPTSIEVQKGSSSEMAEIKEMLKRQQEQLNQLSQQVSQMQNAARPRSRSRNDSVICRRCNQPGHYASHCDNERAPQTFHAPPPSRPLSSAHPSGN
ncbi:hypothetical protein ACEWY4_016866 [Coilia grayii]|uniref:CCHC-type domain-containing protein n=1 Tax=Coilia grayii TaxID=363190 RepID=A0ABD1JPL4_9TELE